MDIAIRNTKMLLIGQQQGMCVKQSTVEISLPLTIKHNKTTSFEISEVTTFQYGLVLMISRCVNPIF